MRCGFTADYLQCRSPILERTIRAQYRSTQVSFTCCFDKYVLQWMGDDAFGVPCFHLQRTEQRAIRRTDDTRVDGCLSGLSENWDFPRFFGLCGSTPAQKSELRAHQMARNLRSGVFTPHKIRAELSSNGSQLKLRTAGLTPHFHAELL